jgi:hypothetical protein
MRFAHIDKRWLQRASILSEVQHCILHQILAVILQLMILGEMFTFLIKFVLRLHKFCNSVVLDILCLNVVSCFLSMLLSVDTLSPLYFCISLFYLWFLQ